MKIALLNRPEVRTEICKKIKGFDFIILSSNNKDKEKPMLICNNEEAKKLAGKLVGGERVRENNFSFEAELQKLLGNLRDVISGEERMTVRYFPKP